MPGPASPTDGCVVCHTGYARIFDQAMAQRSGEKQFVQRSYGRVDSGFWDKNCTACHLGSCLDCHEGRSGGKAERGNLPKMSQGATTPVGIIRDGRPGKTTSATSAACWSTAKPS